MKTDKERLESLRKVQEISKSGYAGCLPNGSIVDRREYPDAVPVQKNSLFGIPEPKTVSLPNERQRQ